MPPLEYEATAGAFLSILRPTDEDLDSRYLYRWFSSEAVQRKVRSFGNQTTNISNLDHKRVAKLLVPVPTIAEQKRIARILDAADALRAKRRESIAQLDALVQSTFLEMFGDPVAKGWQEKRVEELAPEKNAIRTGPFGSQLLHSEFVEAGIKVLGIDNVVSNSFRSGEPRFITHEKYEGLRRYTVRPGDVLITIMGTCGRCAIVPEDIEQSINTKHLCAITLDRESCLPEFMRACFLWHPAARDFLEQNAKGAIMSGLNMGIIKRLPLPVPPIELQQEFVVASNAIDAQRVRFAEHLTELDTLFTSLQSRAFAGEL